MTTTANSTDKENSPSPTQTPAPRFEPLPCKEGGTLPAPTDLTPEQAQAYEAMNDPLRQKTLEMRDLMYSQVTHLLESEYRLGTVVKEIHDNPGTYGATSDIKLAKFFGEYGKTKYAYARRIRERYEPERFQELVNARGPDGHRLEYTHLALLLRVEDDEKADELANQVLESSWSVNELKSYLASKAQPQKRPTAPHTTPRPKTFPGFVEQVVSHADQCRQAYEESWQEGEAIRDAFNAVSAEQLNEDCRKRVQEATKAAREAAEDLRNIATELEVIEKQIAGTLDWRRSGGKRLTIPGGAEVQAYVEPSYPDDDELEGEDE
jgi:hypothetical protein